ITLFQNIFLILSLLGMFASWIIATFLTRHLRKLTRATKEIAAGNLRYRAKIHSNDEVGTLAEAFDGMADKLEENIMLLRQSAEQKEMFMGAFTHEMKTPMTSIIGYADLLRTQKLNQRDQADALDYIFSEGKRLENMSLKMLDLFVADKKEVEFKWVSPANIVNYMVKHLRGFYLKNNIVIDVNAESGECWLEPDLFQTLLVNLLDNAKKAMEQGGKIVVVVKMTEEGCMLSVIDGGKGIPSEALVHLTEAFYRVDKARARSNGSAGLGLALCDKIVELHHGRMEFSSEEGVGTKVTVYMNGGVHEKTE
ncbi:MAG: HAMP domain-containing histidine kinase, partial [Agathobacter sp.]|nr:HAMP domain-containing histidine kinase [Agathobacter sp.]